MRQISISAHNKQNSQPETGRPTTTGVTFLALFCQLSLQVNCKSTLIVKFRKLFNCPVCSQVLFFDRNRWMNECHFVQVVTLSLMFHRQTWWCDAFSLSHTWWPQFYICWSLYMCHKNCLLMTSGLFAVDVDNNEPWIQFPACADRWQCDLLTTSGRQVSGCCRTVDWQLHLVCILILQTSRRQTNLLRGISCHAIPLTCQQ